MRRSRIIAFAVVAFWCAAVAAACGLEDGGNAVVVNDRLDGSGSFDAPLDGTSVDGTTPADGSAPPGDGATTDGATIDASSPPDAGKPYLCATTPVADCATDCPLAPILCGAVNLCVPGCGLCGSGTFQCDACFTDGGRSVSVCEPQDAAAFSSCLGGQTRCTCNDQSDCPGAAQTCNGNMCFECGEVDAGNNMSFCKSGGGNKCKLDPGNFGKCN